MARAAIERIESIVPDAIYSSKVMGIFQSTCHGVASASAARRRGKEADADRAAAFEVKRDEAKHRARMQELELQREQFGKPLPKSFEDRNDWAEYDRPFSETENEMREDMMEASQRSRPPNQKPPRIRWIWYRHPSCGGSRWSSRPPKWYPVNWKMRPERKLRMAGVGVPGGGGDRGTPRGGLQRFWKQGGWQPSAR
ncbi:unnamed protein product [Prorocentrum cordatum]|uniref:Uncharacterized protein n=1 Tax=Prorocentrum cordatum TaxID=2364126 RepID=A0ABN9PA12_9DINO|nr:unnamed protein product [Polarella glacialis]